MERSLTTHSNGTVIEPGTPVPVGLPSNPLRTHQVLAEALKMCKRGEGDDAVIGLLKRRGGLSKGDAVSTFSAVERHLTHSRASARCARNLVVASLLIQVLLTIATFSIDLSSAPVPVLMLVGVETWLFRGDMHTLRRVGRWIQSSVQSSSLAF